MKKLVLFIASVFIVTSLTGQVHNQIPKTDISTSSDVEVLAKKGNKVYLHAADEFSKEGIEFLERELKELAYWPVVNSPEQADFMIELKCRKQQQMTVVAVYSIGKFVNADGKTVYETKEIKGTPTAFNGYNSFDGSVSKMVDKVIKKMFK